MKRNVSAALCMATAALLTVSCKKDDKTTPPEKTSATVSNFTAEPTLTEGHYAFYSLEKNDSVPYTDSASSKWDIAFRSTTILTNGGTSGSGAGGAFVQRGVSFDGFTTISADSVFRTDNSATPAFAIPTGSGNGWYNYDFSTNIISPIPGNVIVVRTASGKYAKVEILSYYKNAPATPTSDDAPRYYTFRFVYQPDGTKNF